MTVLREKDKDVTTLWSIIRVGLSPLLLGILIAGIGGCEPNDGDDAGDDDAADDDAADDDAADDDAGDDDGDPCEGVVAEIMEINPDELAVMLENKDFTLINVHVPDAGQIPQTDVHIAFSDVDAMEEFLGFDLGAKLVVYCLTGPMSFTAASALVERGYCRVHDMPAGMAWWEAQGYPVEH